MSMRALTAFAVIGSLLLVWCFFALWSGLAGKIPCISPFPEVDVASKITLHEKGNRSGLYSTPREVTLLSVLSAIGSEGIRKRFAVTTFGVKSSDVDRVMEDKVENSFYK